jgi:hypothetical protein
MKQIVHLTLGGLAVIILVIAAVIFIRSNPAGIKVGTSTQNVPVVTNNNIRVSSPISNDYISSPLVIKGEAKGTWYFEASFPVVLTDGGGVIIAQGIAQANPPAGGDWMTTNFVPFTATLNFTKPSNDKNGFLILKKDNPSGLPQNADSLEIPVNFK